jgi:hypothetical protein
MTKITTILIIIISFNLNAQIDGKFRHKICKYGPNCFVYKFNQNGTFEFDYSQDILGSGTLIGKYVKTNDTIKLVPDKEYYSTPSKIIETNFKDLKSNQISIILQRASKKGKEQIENLEWYVSINDGEYIKTNQNGILILPKTKINKVQIKDVLEVEVKTDAFYKLTETIFYPKSNNNNIEIYASESDIEINSAMSEWMTKLLLLKGEKLFPITLEPEEAFLGKEKNYYYKFE